jgi:hypothetical protein
VLLEHEAFLVLFEAVENRSNTLQIVLRENFELLNGSKELNKLVDTPTEEIKATKDLVWRELELLTLWHVHESLFGELVLLQVSSVEVDARLKHWNKLFWWVELVIPDTTTQTRE